MDLNVIKQILYKYSDLVDRIRNFIINNKKIGFKKLDRLKTTENKLYLEFFVMTNIYLSANI